MRRAARLVVILGPTAGGKSELAVAVACALPSLGLPAGQVIGADSMQVYRHMDAGTAKPEPELRARAEHHLIDVAEPTHRFTVADWLAHAEPLIDRLLSESVCPIVVGGTNLYIKALLEGMFQGPGQDPALRAELAQVSPQVLHGRLSQVDPAAARRIHPNDQKKLIRALEVYHLTGRPISELQTQWGEEGARGVGGLGLTGLEDGQGTSGDGAIPSLTVGGREGGRPASQGAADTSAAHEVAPHHNNRGSEASPYRRAPILLGLDWPTEAINPRINARVKAMFFPAGGRAQRASENDRAPGDTAARGVAPALNADSRPNPSFPQPPTPLSPESLPDEVRRLESLHLLGPQAREALGYKQVLDHLAGRCSLDEAFEKTKILTRRFAKTQRTWLKRYRGVTWLNPTELDWQTLVARAVEAVDEGSRREA